MRTLIFILLTYYFLDLNAQSLYLINKESGKEKQIETGRIEIEINNAFYFNNIAIPVESQLIVNNEFNYIGIIDSFLLFEKLDRNFQFQPPSLLDSLIVGDTIKVLLKDVYSLHYCNCNKTLTIASISLLYYSILGLATSGVLFLTNEDANARVFVYSGLASYLTGGLSIYLLTGRDYPLEKWDYLIK